MAKDTTTVDSIRGKRVVIPGVSTKADAARELFRLPANYTVTEVSKALGMSYSQAHSIAKKMGDNHERTYQGHPAHGAAKATDQYRRDQAKKLPSGQYHKGPARGQRLTEDEAATWVPPKPVARGKPGKVGKLKSNPRIGKLRTGGLPRDIPVGECANCGYDLVVRPTPQGFVFTHINATSEEYLSTIQFCQAVPAMLVK